MTFDEYFETKYKTDIENESLMFSIKVIAQDAWNAAQTDAAKHWTNSSGMGGFDELGKDYE